MKKLISALMLIAILLTLSACGGNVQAGPPDNGVAHTGETESIWLITRINYYDDEDELYSSTDEYTYNDEGVIIKYTETEYYDGELTCSWTEIYDDNGNITEFSEFEDGEYYSEKYVNEYTDGNLTKVTTYNADGKIEGYNTYAYKNGHLIEESYYDEDGVLRSTYAYDDKGNNIKTVFYYEGEITQIISSDNEYADGKLIKQNHYQDGIPDGYTTYTYDDNGKLIKTAYSHTDPAGGSTSTYSYDDDGNLVEEVHAMSYGGDDWFTRHTYAYNEANQMIEAREYLNTTLQETRSYSYDDDGGLIGCTITDHEDGGSYRWEITSVKKAVPVSKAEELKEQQKDLLD